jgi:hypothetical protein
MLKQHAPGRDGGSDILHLAMEGHEYGCDDIKAAFLHGIHPDSETVYMGQPRV